MDALSDTRRILRELLPKPTLCELGDFAWKAVHAKPLRTQKKKKTYCVIRDQLMWMTKKDIADYPELFIYLAKVQIFLTVAKLMKNLRHWGDYDNPGNPKSIKLAPIFLYGTSPLVKVRRLSGFLCSAEYAYGCVDATRPWEIGLDRNMVESFNSDPYNYVNWDNTAKGNFVPIVGVTILHELCHWGRLQSESPLIGIEEGDEFEKATYGTVIGGHRF